VEGTVRPTQAAIHIDGLTKRFGKLTAVSGLTLDVAQGEVVGFLGPNGAGKTTTIRMLMGFIRAAAGTCEVLGGSLAENVQLRGRVGYLPGDFRIDPAMTGEDLFSWFGRLRGGVARSRVRELVSRLNLDSDRPFHALSKGNRQKVGLVQAFMNDPDVLILDEPTTGLDPLMQREFLHLVSEAASRGAAILFSSHVLPEVERVANRVAIIREGRLVTCGPVQDLLARARHRLELRFAGPVPPNLLSNVQGVSEVEIHGDSATIAVDGPVGPAMDAALRGPSLLTVRPAGDDLEDLFVSIYGVKGEG
jgi:ABC-2 type transport system ATP-binding protein